MLVILVIGIITVTKEMKLTEIKQFLMKYKSVLGIIAIMIILYQFRVFSTGTSFTNPIFGIIAIIGIIFFASIVKFPETNQYGKIFCTANIWAKIGITYKPSLKIFLYPSEPINIVRKIEQYQKMMKKKRIWKKGQTIQETIIRFSQKFDISCRNQSRKF